MTAYNYLPPAVSEYVRVRDLIKWHKPGRIDWFATRQAVHDRTVRQYRGYRMDDIHDAVDDTMRTLHKFANHWTQKYLYTHWDRGYYDDWKIWL